MPASWPWQVGGIETGPQEGLRASEAANFTLESWVERSQVQGCSVGQCAIRLVPDILSGVGLRGLCGDALDMQAGTTADDLRDVFTPVNRPLPPRQYHGTLQVAKHEVDTRGDIEAGEIPGANSGDRGPTAGGWPLLPGHRGPRAGLACSEGTRSGPGPWGPRDFGRWEWGETRFPPRRGYGPHVRAVFSPGAILCASTARWPLRPVGAPDARGAGTSTRGRSDAFTHGSGAWMPHCRSITSATRWSRQRSVRSQGAKGPLRRRLTRRRLWAPERLGGRRGVGRGRRPCPLTAARLVPAAHRTRRCA